MLAGLYLKLIGIAAVIALLVGAYLYVDHRGYTRAQVEYEAKMATMVSQAKLDAANALLKKAQDEAARNAKMAEAANQQAQDTRVQLDAKEAELQARIDADNDPADSRWTAHDLERLQHQ